MYGSKQKSNVALFPLCDSRGVLIDALCNTSDNGGTRGDALVFAWRLELPKSMNVADAADSVLKVAMSESRQEWTREQLVIIRELMVLAGREMKDDGANTIPERRSPHRRARKAPSRTQPKPLTDASAQVNPFADDLPTNQRSNQPKETKQWWKLVGKPDAEADKASGQRKTRTERVSREP